MLWLGVTEGPLSAEKAMLGNWVPDGESDGVRSPNGGHAEIPRHRTRCTMYQDGGSG
jgi:hypothetical protein